MSFVSIDPTIPTWLAYCASLKDPPDPCNPCPPPVDIDILYCINSHTEGMTNFCLGPVPPSGVRPYPPTHQSNYYGKFFGVTVEMGYNYNGPNLDSTGNLEYLYSVVQTVTYTYGGLVKDNPTLYGTPCGTDSTHSIEYRPDPTYQGIGYPPCITWTDDTISTPTNWNHMVVSGPVTEDPGYTLSQYDPTMTVVISP